MGPYLKLVSLLWLSVVTTEHWSSSNSTVKPPATVSLSPSDFCSEICPPGYFIGTNCCYTVVPLQYSKAFNSAYNYCMKTKTGKLIALERLVSDKEAISSMLNDLEIEDPILFISRVPMAKEGTITVGEVVSWQQMLMNNLTTRTVELFEGGTQGRGICRVPQYCSHFSCSLEVLYSLQPGLLPLHMGSPLIFKERRTIPCQNPSRSVLQVTCDSHGQFQSTPPECKSIMNKTDPCWVPVVSLSKCNGRGDCINENGMFKCACDKGYGGETCTINLRNVTIFGEKTGQSVPYLTPSTLLKIILTLSGFIKLFTQASGKSFFFISLSPQEYYASHRWTTFTLSGLLTALYSNPSFLQINSGSCKIIYYLVYLMTTIGFWFSAMQSWNTLVVFSGWGRPRWNYGLENMKKSKGKWKLTKGKKKWYLTKRWTVVAPICAIVLLQAYLFQGVYLEIPRVHTCLGAILDYRNPLIKINVILTGTFAFLASGTALFAIFYTKNNPSSLLEQHEYYEFFRPEDEREDLHKIIRSDWLLVSLPLLTFAIFIVEVFNQDWIAHSTDMSVFQLICFLLLVLALGMDIWELLAFNSSLLEKVMFWGLPLSPNLPIWPNLSPVKLLSHEEIIGKSTKPWPITPLEEKYISEERRQTCEKRLTRSYLQHRLKGLQPMESIDKIIFTFLESLDERGPEYGQWLLVLHEWKTAIGKYDNVTIFPQRKKMITINQKMDQIMSAPLRSYGQKYRERKAWFSLFHLYQMLDYNPHAAGVTPAEGKTLGKWLEKIGLNTVGALPSSK